MDECKVPACDKPEPVIPGCAVDALQLTPAIMVLVPPRATGLIIKGLRHDLSDFDSRHLKRAVNRKDMLLSNAGSRQAKEKANGNVPLISPEANKNAHDSARSDLENSVSSAAVVNAAAAQSTRVMLGSVKHVKTCMERVLDLVNSATGENFTDISCGFVPDPRTADEIHEEHCRNSSGNSVKLVCINVPKDAPLTVEQAIAWSMWWPCTVKANRSCVPREAPLSDEEMSEMCRHMTHAVKAAKGAKELGCLPVGVAIVDPETGKVVVTAGGVVPCCWPPGDVPSDQAITNAERKFQALLHFAQYEPYHPAGHAIMVAIARIAESQLHNYRTQFPGTQRGLCTQVPAMDEYLLNDMDVYVTVEPCPMCAMALVHSRARRVVYGTPSSTGALGSRWSLHSSPGINHRYYVYSNCLRSQTDALGASGCGCDQLARQSRSI